MPKICFETRGTKSTLGVGWSQERGQMRCTSVLHQKDSGHRKLDGTGALTSRVICPSTIRQMPNGLASFNSSGKA